MEFSHDCGVRTNNKLTVGGNKATTCLVYPPDFLFNNLISSLVQSVDPQK